VAKARRLVDATPVALQPSKKMKKAKGDGNK
jgi:hypothetical protein